MMKYKVKLYGQDNGWLTLVVDSRNEVSQLVVFGLDNGLDVDISQVKDDAEQDH